MQMKGFIKRISMLAAVALAIGTSSRDASAATITWYTSLADWQAAAGSTVTEGFDDATLIAGLGIDDFSLGGGLLTGLASTQFNDAGNPKLNFTPGTLAFGGDFDYTAGGAGDGIVYVASFLGGGTGTTFVGNPIGGPFTGFLGFVSDTAVTQLRMDGPALGDETFTLDNVRISGSGSGDNGGGDQPVPEPSSLLLLGGGLVAFAKKALKRQA